MKMLMNWIFALMLLRVVKAFNIAVTPNTVATFEINIPKISNESAYVGYTLASSLKNGTLRIRAGAPKYDPNPMRPYLTNGTIAECFVDVEGFRQRNSLTTTPNVPHNCSVFLMDSMLPLADDHASGSDALGTTLFSVTQNDLAVCTSGRQKKCQTSYFSPGACFSGTTPSQFRPVPWDEKPCFLNYVDMLYLVDSSNSINATNFETMRKVMLEVSNVFTNIIGDTMQVAILQYGQNDPFNVSYLYENPRFYQQPLTFGQCQTVECLKEAIANNMTHLKAANTYTATAIKRVTLMDFAESENAAIAQKVLVLITDGEATDHRRLLASYQLTQEHNITVYAIGVGGRINRGQLRVSANGGVSDDRVLTSNDFSQLLTTLRSLTRTISGDISEGQTANISVANATENAMFGFSGEKTKDGGVAFGAIGAYQNLGTVVEYVSAELANPYMLPFEQVNEALPGLTMDTYDSYLGYAITSGYYEGVPAMFTAASAPRYLLLGAVVVFRTVDKTMYTIQAPPSGQQRGSYFGASLVTCDIDNDNKDDLLVGAPLYIGESYDEGRVFVYSSQNGSGLLNWATSTYSPVVLTGGRNQGGRFGTSMVCAGDLDRDGYSDVVIAAPFADAGEGLVYVYHGSAVGLADKPGQVITASSLSYSGLTGFGLSLEGGIDVDDNQYPDILIGAPKHGLVAILRSRPVVQFNTTVSFNRASIDIIDCLLTPNASCAVLTACFAYTGISVEPQIDVNYEIQLDMGFGRVQFKQGGNSPQEPVLVSNITLTKDNRSCVSLLVDARENIQDFETLVIANLTYSLSAEHISRPMTSVQRSDAIPAIASIPFEKSCGNDTTCLYDLSITGNVLLPKVYHPSTGELLGDGFALVLASDEQVVVKVNFTNKGEIAYGTRLAVFYSDGFSWIRLQNVVSSSSSLSCVVDDPGEVAQGDLRRNVLTYRHNGFLKNVMLHGSWCYFECVLSTSGLALKGSERMVNIGIEAYTSHSQNQEDINPSDNTLNSTYGVKYISDVNTRRLTVEHNVVYNFTEETAEIGSVYGIGNGTSDILMEYEVLGRGYSTVPLSSITLKYPAFYNGTHRLLYLFQVNCPSVQGDASCDCDQTNVNSLNLSLVDSPDGGNRYNVTPNPQKLEPRLFDCSKNSNNSNGTSCDEIQCRVNNLGVGDIVRFKATFRLWTQTLRIPINDSVRYLSQFQYSAQQSPQIVGFDGKSLPLQTSEVTVTATPYTPPVEIPPSYSWVIFIAAVATGTVILVVIIIIMYKLGFFQSKYADLKEEAHQWQTAQTNEAASSPPNYTEAESYIDE